MTERVAQACAGRPWQVLGGWVVAVIASIVVIGLFLGDALTTEAGVTTETDSKRGDELIAERLGDGAGPSEALVVRSETLRVDDVAFRAEVERLIEAGLSAGRSIQPRWTG